LAIRIFLNNAASFHADAPCARALLLRTIIAAGREARQLALRTDSPCFRQSLRAPHKSAANVVEKLAAIWTYPTEMTEDGGDSFVFSPLSHDFFCFQLDSGFDP
jgi:hypothetical protein